MNSQTVEAVSILVDNLPFLKGAIIAVVLGMFVDTMINWFNLLLKLKNKGE